MIFILIWVKCNNEKWRVNMYKMAEKMRRGISFLMIVLVFLAMGMAGVRTSAAEKNTTKRRPLQEKTGRKFKRNDKRIIHGTSMEERLHAAAAVAPLLRRTSKENQSQ